jgi:hypothetical protein
MPHIYIVLTQTGTNVSRAIKLFTRCPYNHSSLTDDAGLNEMFSFCRNYRRFPLPASFNKETVGNGTLGLFKQIPCEIYEIELTDEQYAQYKSIISHFIENRSKYEYNLLGLWTIPFKKNFPRKNKYVCSQFVAYVLSQLEIKLNKEIFLNSPEDLRYISCAKLVYSGELNRYYSLNSDTGFSPLPFSQKAQFPL